MIKKTSMMLALFVLSASIIGCNKQQETQSKENIEVAEEVSMPSATTVDNDVRSTESDKPEHSENIDNMSFSSITEMFEKTDPDYSKGSDSYMAAIMAYENYLDSKEAEHISSEYYGGIGHLRLSFGYVDEDEIPELFVAADTIHTFGINVFTYDSNENKVIRIGEFSSFGHMGYVEKRNRIISTYGSSGLYMNMFSSIEQFKPQLIGSVTEDMSFAELYFARYPVADGADGSHKDGYGSLTDGTGPNAIKVDFPDHHDVTYIVSKDEYDQIVTVYENFPQEGDVKYIDYESMFDVELK